MSLAGINPRKLYRFLLRQEADCQNVLAYVTTIAGGTATAIGKDMTLLGLKRVKENQACGQALKEIFAAIDAGDQAKAVAIANQILDAGKPAAATIPHLVPNLGKGTEA